MTVNLVRVNGWVALIALNSACVKLTIFFSKFHLGCVGLTEIPEGAWYCEDCKTDGL